MCRESARRSRPVSAPWFFVRSPLSRNPKTRLLIPMYMRLEAWRAGVAVEMGVPAYVVIPDAVLRAVSARRPETRVDLAGIRGVGPRALAKFADDLLRLVRHEGGTAEQAVAPLMPPG